MINRKIVADSSANLLSLPGVNFACAPLKVITDSREFTDNADLNTEEMTAWFSGYKGKSKTSCPSVADWMGSFGDADEVFCVTITSGLSGSYNAACAAARLYEAEYPGRKVCVVDSLSAGPELALLAEKLASLIAQNLSFAEISRQIQAYTRNTGLIFMLESLKNFAANGRVSPAVAKLAGVLGIRIIGKASDKGTLEPTDKCRGDAKSLEKLVARLKEYGLKQGKVRIAHCQNLSAANTLKEKILSAFPTQDVEIAACRGLCSYYAEAGGLLVGFEKC